MTEPSTHEPTSVTPARDSFNAHHPASTRTVHWLTPPSVIDALGLFDLDPCAAPHPRPWDTAREHYTLPVDGLAHAWHGRVWLNPPYGAETWQWVKRLADHGDGIALIFARTDVAGFHDHVWDRASAVLFLRGRLRFHRADGEQPAANAGAPSCLVAYGSRNVEALQQARLALPGKLVTL